jgi:hypothetical protein
MDRDLTEVAHNEARVANEATGRHPWSAIDPVRAPWLHELLRGEPEPDLLSPLGVRRALVDVLADLAHAPNPRAWGRGELTSTERAGAEALPRPLRELPRGEARRERPLHGDPLRAVGGG